MWITVATPPMTDLALFDKICAAAGDPAGALARYAGPAGDGRLRVVVLWESQAHAEAFFADKLGPAIATVLGPEPMGRPEVVGITVEREYVAAPAA